MDIQRSLLLDGRIHANGADGGSAASGAGSGGSVLIQADGLSGHGVVTSNGGRGEASGGGGSGGRVAVRVRSFNSFLGSLAAQGGSGDACGAAGTVYVQRSDTGVTQHAVTADNGGKVCPDVFTTVIWPDTSTPLSLTVKGNSFVRFEVHTTPTEPLKISHLDGDRTGGIILQDQQVAEIATAYGTEHPFALKCKLELQAGSSATLPSKLLLTDPDSTASDRSNFNISGSVLGLTELVVAEGGRAAFSLESKNGIDASHLGEAGNLMLSKLSVTHGGRITLGADDLTEFSLRVLQELDVEYGGEVVGRTLSVSVPKVSVAFGGLVTSSGLGGQPRVGGTEGGSHGGNGGSETSATLPDTVADVTASGEGGKSVSGDDASSGGAGGGFIRLTIDNEFTLHGVVSSNGNKGVNSGGGGAGGGVVISTGHLLGGGQVQVSGGDAGDNGGGGGGGGGGRIYTYIRSDNNFTGTYVVRGGSSQTQAGGSGTAYVEEYWTGEKTLIISNTGANGSSYAHTTLHFDNGTTTFTHLDLGQNVQLVIPASGVYFIAQEISCDTGTVVYVEDDVVFSADVNKNETRLSCSFDISERAELRLPNVVELLGANNKFDGNSVWLCVYQINKSSLL